MFYSEKPVISFIISLLLLPVTFLYYIAVIVRHFFYDKKILHSYKPGIRTVSVGNITAGGTGKTPTVISLVNSLSSMGVKTAVVTRGYGRKSRSTIFVDENTPVSESGDEPMVICKKTKSTVVCEKDRYKAIKLLNKNYDMVILDDAFQHRKIIKDVDIVLVDENRFLKNHLLLPSGILRDTVTRLKKCDIIILSKIADMNSLSVQKKVKFLRRYKKRIILSKIVYSNITDGNTILSAGDLSAKKISLFCGIADPVLFFEFFKNHNIVNSISLPDHFNYSKADKILYELKEGSDVLITTYKDFIKLPQKTIKKFGIHYLDIDLLFFDDENKEIKNIGSIVI